MFRQRKKIYKNECVEMLFRHFSFNAGPYYGFKTRMKNVLPGTKARASIDYLYYFYDGFKRDIIDEKRDILLFSFEPRREGGRILIRLYWTSVFNMGARNHVEVNINQNGSFDTYIGADQWEHTPGLDYAYPRSRHV